LFTINMKAVVRISLIAMLQCRDINDDGDDADNGADDSYDGEII